MMDVIPPLKMTSQRRADWELDFYSRPILEPDGKKRWELLITSSEDFDNKKPFRWEKKCPASEVNSLWLAKALQEAIEAAKIEGWGSPLRIRCWRSSMKTMIKRAATELGLEVIPSRRTYTLIEWLSQREKDVYPNEEGYMTGPIAPPASRIRNQPLPLPETVRGDAWSLASLSVELLREAEDWPIEFRGLLPIQKSIDDNYSIPGLRLFSKTRALALAGWLSSLEPVKLVVESNQLVLEAGQDDRWLVSDLKGQIAEEASRSFNTSREKTSGLQFISVQTTPDEKQFSGFWMLKDLPD